MNLKKLSQMLNLSQTTVSRALNGFPEVKEKTRIRVLAAAAQHNYRPSRLAKSLATGRAMSIGHVLPTSKQEMVNPIFTDFIAGAGEVYAKSGYHMSLTVVTDDNEEAAYREMASKRSVDGVIVHGPRVPDSRIELLQDIGLPFVVHGRAQDTKNDYSWFDVNNRSAFKNATKFLIDFGHKHIALLNGREIMDFASRRRQGYEDALTSAGLVIDPNIMRNDDMTEPYGYTSTMQMMNTPTPPTAFLVSSIIPALGVRRALLDLGIQPGKQVSIITHDDVLSFLKMGGDVPLFTATKSSVREAGKACAEMLLTQINNPEHKICHELWEAELVIGTSTGPAPTSD
ncbi:MAG: LacI family DNA-binding transcriptional regulator [Rhizobiales bacterium]|nr:substrate-binding domain-containing protein [Hyphomicrobiales bacterium]NRB15401.1 LacI family DNA-binding transcriptional regulator [Hyphomicrobiales bacterium]